MNFTISRNGRSPSTISVVSLAQKTKFHFTLNFRDFPLQKCFHNFIRFWPVAAAAMRWFTFFEIALLCHTKLLLFFVEMASSSFTRNCVLFLSKLLFLLPHKIAFTFCRNCSSIRQRNCVGAKCTIFPRKNANKFGKLNDEKSVKLFASSPCPGALFALVAQKYMKTEIK